MFPHLKHILIFQPYAKPKADNCIGQERKKVFKGKASLKS